MSGFDFHAAADGKWINDPNGLIAVPGGYRLFAQYRAEAPYTGLTEWASFFSPNLLDWQFEGVAIPGRDGRSAYSGCVEVDGELVRAILTEADPGPPPRQRQVRYVSRTGGRSFSFDGVLSGLPQGRADFRDPMVIPLTNGSLVVAEPGSWSKFDYDPPSRLSVYAEAEGEWQSTGSIGPWMAPDKLWEVPVLLPASILGSNTDCYVLILSIVDRSNGKAWSEVRYWVGEFDGRSFTRSVDHPLEGRLLDGGPDFYATCVGFPDEDGPLIIAWASNWQTARHLPWPGIHGGPISLPRRLSLVNGRLQQRPAPFCVEAFARPVPASPRAGMGTAALPGNAWRLRVEGLGIVTVQTDGRALTVERRTPDAVLDWKRVQVTDVVPGERRLRLFVDGPLIELFIEPEGRSVTIALPGEALSWSLEAGGAPIPIDWRVRT